MTARSKTHSPSDLEKKMIEDVQDLSFTEKRKRFERKKLLVCIGKSFMAIPLSVCAMMLLALALNGNFLEAFDRANVVVTTCKFVIAAALMAILFAAIYHFTHEQNKSTEYYWIACIAVVASVVASLIGIKYCNIYVIHVTLAELIVIELVDRRSAALSLVVSGLMVVVIYLGNPAYDIGVIISAIICNSISGIIINFLVHRHYSRFKFLLMTFIVPFTVLPLVEMFTFIEGDLDMTILWNTIGSYGANVVSGILFMPIVAILESVFNIPDDFRLSELCNLSNPLLKRLASEAPGTFNHSLVVGTLAEACASAIGENPNMARCAAYYHDIGKLKAPTYFSENQSTYNPHDELIPEVSVSMITSHTLFGEILAKQNRLPSEIVDICRQHHGTSTVGYFYRKALALKEDGDLAVNKYTYAGPKPQTKVAAIIMVADTIEAAMRAYMPDTREEYEARINKLVDEKIAMRQFDECPITMNDISVIKNTIIEVLPSIHHKRVDYDKRKEPATEENKNS